MKEDGAKKTNAFGDRITALIMKVKLSSIQQIIEHNMQFYARVCSVYFIDLAFIVT